MEDNGLVEYEFDVIKLLLNEILDHVCVDVKSSLQCKPCDAIVFETGFRLPYSDSENESKDGVDSDIDSDSEWSEEEEKEKVKTETSPKLKTEPTESPVKSRDDDDDLFGGHLAPKYIATRGELTLADLPPVERMQIAVDGYVELEYIGQVTANVDQLIVIKSEKVSIALNEETMLFLENRKILGKIFEIFGPVQSPYYSIRFASEEEAKGVAIGTKVYFVPKDLRMTKYVFVENIQHLKGSDASWEHNNEPPPQYLDYSDDEEERRVKSQRKPKFFVQTYDSSSSEATETSKPRPHPPPPRKRNNRHPNHYQQQQQQPMSAFQFYNPFMGQMQGVREAPRPSQPPQQTYLASSFPLGHIFSSDASLASYGSFYTPYSSGSMQPPPPPPPPPPPQR